MNESKSVGKCPLCGASVEDRAKVYFCSVRECKFALWKNNRYFESIGKAPTGSVVSALLRDGKVKLKGCKSARTGKNYDAILCMEVAPDGKINFKMEFDKGGKK